MIELNVPQQASPLGLIRALALLAMLSGAKLAWGQGDSEVPIVPLDAGRDAPGKSLSTSKQFYIYGRTLPLRSAFSVFAERVKTDYLNLVFRTGRGLHTGKIDRWRYPIIIQVRDEAPGLDERSATSRIRQLDHGGFRLELTVRIGDGFDTNELQHELLRLLLAESILREHKTIRVGGRTELLPKWLMAGVSETLGRRSTDGRSELYEKVFKTGRILSVEEILSTDPDRLDSVSRTIYELSSAGLLQTLLDQPGGSNRLRAMISELATHTGPLREILIRHFPGMRTSRNSLEKWWALQMAMLSEPGVFDLMSPEETELALAEALMFQLGEVGDEVEGPAPDEGTGSDGKRIPGIVRIGRGVIGLLNPKGGRRSESGKAAENQSAEDVFPNGQEAELFFACGIEEVDRYIDHPRREEALKPVQLKLAELSHRSHPLYRQVIHDYQEFVGRLSQGNGEGAGKKLADLAGRRTAIQRRALAVADHLNWFEATQDVGPGGKFEAFHRAVDMLDNAPRPRRKDPISRYLDALEQEFK